MKLTLRQQTWIFISIVLATSLIGIIFLTHYLYERFYIDKQMHLLLARGELLTDLYYEDEDKSEFLDRVDWMNRCAEANVLFAETINSLNSYSTLKNDYEFITEEEVEQLQNGKIVTIVHRYFEVERPILGVAVPVFNHSGSIDGIIFLYIYLVEMFEPFKTSKFIIAASFFILLVFIIILVRRIMNKITEPLEYMKTISEKMAAGDFSQRIEVKRSDEIGSLSKSFNTLAAALEREEQKKREFLSNVSHELRTPLSYIKGYTEGILDDVVDNPKRYIQTIQSESDRMQRLVNDLLDLAQLEGESYPMKKQPLPFAQLLEDVLERFELAAEQKHITITKRLDYDAIILGDADRLEQVFGNIIDNALRYSPKNQKLEVEMKTTDHTIEVAISDSGPGIPEDALPKLVERFYRVDKGRSREVGGTGLGLSIVAEIVKKHDAELEFHSRLNEGTTVKITFPKNI